MTKKNQRLLRKELKKSRTLATVDPKTWNSFIL
jgi:ribosomal protein L19E